MADLQAYVDGLLGGEDPYLRQIREEAEREGIPQIQVPIELGRLLQILIVQINARHVLEIGALFGYSSILMARALPAGGKIVSLELSDKHAAIARKNIEGAGFADSIEIRQGPASDSLAAMQRESFDLVFIDADKVGYPRYLEHALRLTHPGSVIVADNAWRGGAVAEAGTDDESARAMAEFNRSFVSNPRLLATIIPTRNCSDAAALGVVRSPEE
ncbi:MAG TPA: O-methyltransferase [Chloroflexota bacterium]|nr:O-methyltransferase [Chloroflexota bacterium]